MLCFVDSFNNYSSPETIQEYYKPRMIVCDFKKKSIIGVYIVTGIEYQTNFRQILEVNSEQDYVLLETTNGKAHMVVVFNTRFNDIASSYENRQHTSQN